MSLLPIATFAIVQQEFQRLEESAPFVARALIEELGGHAETPDGDLQVMLNEMDEIEDEIEELEVRLEVLRSKTQGLDSEGAFPVATIAQAATLRSLLRQYEGIDSEVLAQVEPWP